MPDWRRSWANFSIYSIYSCIRTDIQDAPPCIFWGILTPLSLQPGKGPVDVSSPTAIMEAKKGTKDKVNPTGLAQNLQVDPAV
jgi:hypothetical protein